MTKSQIAKVVAAVIIGIIHGVILAVTDFVDSILED